MGVVAVGALALGVSALAAPRPVDDSAVRGTNKGKTEVTRLVTGDPAQINAVVAGTPPTAIFAISPVASKVGSYPANTAIVADAACSASGGLCRLNADAGNFRAYFDVTIKDWDPNADGSPGMHSLTVKVDAAGYLGANAVPPNPGVNLIPAQTIPCTLNSDCVTLFGEAWAQCVLGFCKAGYVDIPGFLGPANNYCHFGSSGGCASGGSDTSSNFYRWFAIHSADNRADALPVYYIGSLVLDIPSGECSATPTLECGTLPGLTACPGIETCTSQNVKGKYVVSLVPAEVLFADVTGAEFATLEENGFIVNIRTGSCCVGSPPVCTDTRTLAECNTAGGNFNVDKLCSAGCAECFVAHDPLCNDSDACTDDDCTVSSGLCTHFPKSGFNPIKGGSGDTGNCCNKTTGALTDKDDGDACTCDSCPDPNNRGTALHTPCAGSCDDGNSCTTPDICDGSRSEANGGCSGTDINTLDCDDTHPCPEGTTCGTAFPGKCFCTLIPNVQFLLSPSEPKTCVGGFRDGLPCGTDADCPGGAVAAQDDGPYCDTFANGANCFDEGEKITALVHVGSTGDPINGGEFLMTYDPSCLKWVSATCLTPYGTTVYGPVVNAAAGTIFIACGVDPFGGINGPLGNRDMVSLSFIMIGDCSNPLTPHPCVLGFADNNPLHSYLVNDEGQAVNIEAKPKELNVKGELTLEVPDNVKTNVDCDKPTAVVTWPPPAATFSCGDVNLTCRGVHESGLVWSQSRVMGGGVFPQGASSFCCYAAAKDKCDQHVGCPGAANDCTGSPKPTGCWTVQVNDQVSMDIDIGLEPPMTTTNRDGTLTRCIEFCLYANCIEAPLCFQDDITFGGIFNWNGKSQGKIKAPKGQWDCITAQDQLHSLRSCCKSEDGCLHCDGSQLVADFTGDPELGGNWLIGGNLDAYKKDVPKAGLNIIDILDFGMFLSQYGLCYADKSPDCHDGPHADINGDGCVTAADYQFIIRNFLASSKDCCCVGDGASAATPLTEVSVDELRQMGMGELAVADLNGDGLVNAQDMDAFMQGARPTKTPNDRKGGKGLRSGR